MKTNNDCSHTNVSKKATYNILMPKNPNNFVLTLEIHLMLQWLSCMSLGLFPWSRTTTRVSPTSHSK